MMQKEVSEECAPAQVAPTSPATSTLPNPQTASQPHPQTPSQPDQAEPSPVSCMSIYTTNGDPGSPLGSLTTHVDLAEGALPAVEPQAQEASTLEEDIQMTSQPQDDVHMDSQSQEEKLVDHMTPVKPPAMQDSDSKMHTPPPVTPSLAVDVAAQDADSKDASPESVSALPTPATTAPPSDRAPSPTPALFTLGRSAVAEHFKRARIFPKTRELMRYSSFTTSMIASRGFERGTLPMRQTTPPLLKRRYSIDVNTVNDWNIRRSSFKHEEVRHMYRSRFSSEQHTNKSQPETQLLDCRSLEVTNPFTTLMDLPIPARYLAFAPTWLLNPQYNTDIYLELGDATIRNDAFWFITVTSWRDWGNEVWMRDESIDMALEVLRREADCESHGIAIANSTMAQICYFAAFSEDSTSQEYDEYKARFRGKNWIFLVVNDAIGGIENGGTHWSLVAMDLKYRHAYYYDSLYNDRYHTDMGRDISLGMLNILGEKAHHWKYNVMHDCPNQNWDNQFELDSGACGPFVYKMTEILVDRIKEHRRMGREDECYIHIDWAFRAQFKAIFHSLEVRESIKRRIAQWKALTDTPKLVDQHDQGAIRDVRDIALDDGPVVSIEVPPPRPVLPFRREPHRAARHTNHYSQSHHRRGSNRDDAIEVKDSDSDLSSNVSSSGRTEVHDIELDDNPVSVPFENPDVIMSDDGTVEDDYDCHDNGISINRHAEFDEDASGGVNLPEDADDENEDHAVTRIA
jgi:hypothetical protein